MAQLAQPRRLAPRRRLAGFNAAFVLAAAACVVCVRAGAEQAGGGCSAANPCKNWGTCDTISGACACPPSYGGPLCETAMFPACRYNDTLGPHGEPAGMWCNMLGPRTCECYRQCHSHPMILNHEAGWPCFTRTGKSSHEQTSDLPPEDEAGVEYYRSWQQAGNAPMTRQEFITFPHSNFPQDLVPPALCPAACHGNGWCDGKQQRCLCHVGFEGTDCGQVNQGICINGCTRRGRCLRGFCSCDMGWFGIDCSIELAALAAAHVDDIMVEMEPPTLGEAIPVLPAASIPLRREPQYVTPRIYVYELPPWMNLAHFMDHHDYHGDGIYSGWRVFFEQLLRDWDVRTLDPEEANLFYVPAFTFAFTDNGGPTKLYIERVINFIKTEHPAIWDRNGGADHIFWAPGDRGNCPLPEDQQQLLWMTYFALTHHKFVDPNAPESATCFNSGHGVVPPPYHAMAGAMALTTYGEDDAGGSGGDMPGGARDTLFFFAGSLGLDAKPWQYSQGVRQRLWTLYHGKGVPGFIIEERVSDTANIMRGSKFCLVPSGYGWGMRIVEAMVTGCIPVIIQEGIHQPGDDVLAYDEFALRLNLEDIDNLPAILNGYSPEEVAQLQRGVYRNYRNFVWGPKGRAYDLTIRSLKKKLYNIQARFHHHR